MKNMTKYQGVIPAFYACYDEEGEISPERTRALVEYFIAKSVQGLYVNGSSGECIYLSVEDRKRVLEEVMKVAKGLSLVSLPMWLATILKTAWSWLVMRKVWESMLLQLFRRFISVCQSIRLPNIGMTSVRRRLILIS